MSRFYLLGVVQRGVSVVRRFKAAHQAGVKASAAFDEPPRHGQLLLQQFIECKYGWIEGADSCGRDRRTLSGFMLNVVSEKYTSIDENKQITVLNITCQFIF